MAELYLGNFFTLSTGKDYLDHPMFEIDFDGTHGVTPDLYEKDAIKVIEMLSECFGLDVVINEKENEDAN